MGRIIFQLFQLFSSLAIIFMDLEPSALNRSHEHDEHYVYSPLPFIKLEHILHS